MTVAGAPAYPFEEAIAARARRAGIELAAGSVSALAAHARAVLQSNALLHLTTITAPEELVERHVGEAFEGAVLLEPALHGVLLDLGSGNGYPGIPLSLARPALTPVLAESSRKKAAFLRDMLELVGRKDGLVLERSVQRTDDLADIPAIAVLATRAMGGWERIVPKLAKRLAPDGRVLIWAGASLSAILERHAWSRLKLVAHRPLPGRASSQVTCLSLK